MGEGAAVGASMRPPDLPGGNPRSVKCGGRGSGGGFNEAAGFTRRKRGVAYLRRADPPASMRPPDLPGGNSALGCGLLGGGRPASMRPPDLPGGNQVHGTAAKRAGRIASMRPPDLPGGNLLSASADTPRL